ncbi:hypothetical protein [Flavobacterium sp.]
MQLKKKLPRDSNFTTKQLVDKEKLKLPLLKQRAMLQELDKP